jgi:hypothetical protein
MAFRYFVVTSKKECHGFKQIDKGKDSPEV